MINQHPARSVLLVRVSWCIDAVTSTERTVTTLAASLATASHRVVIATATEQCDGTGLPGVIVEQLDLPVTLPCTSQELREALIVGEAKIRHTLSALITRHRVDIVVFVGVLWGLGRLRADMPPGVQRVLLVATLAQEQDMPPALAYADTVIASSEAVLQQAADAAWPTRQWRVVPDAFLHDPGRDVSTDRALRAPQPDGPVRVLVPPGRDVGVLELVAAARAWHRTVEVALSPPGVLDVRGSQTLRQQCHQIADRAPNISLCAPPRWETVSGWLARAALVIIACRRPASGLTAIEAMSQGTPVIAYNTRVLAELLGPVRQGSRPLLADVMHGPNALLFLADTLLADRDVYRATCRAAHSRARDFHPARIADLFCSALQ